MSSLIQDLMSAPSLEKRALNSFCFVSLASRMSMVSPCSPSDTSSSNSTSPRRPAMVSSRSSWRSVA